MIKKYNLLKFSLLLFCLISSGSSLYGQLLTKIFLKEVLSIGSTESNDIYQWASVCTDDSSNIYLTDIMDYSIKKFDKSGKLLQKTGRRGRGPGEFTAIRLISFKDGLIYVTDQYKPGIQVFDKNLNYKRNINYYKPIVDIKVVSPNKIVIAGGSMQKGKYIDVIDSSGHELYSIPYCHSKNKEGFLLDAIHFKIDNNDNIYIAYIFKDIIEKVNKNGAKLLWTKSLFHGKRTTIKNIKDMNLPQDIFYKCVELDTLGNVFILGGSFSKNKSRDVYVFTPNGKYITTFTLPYPTHYIYIDKQNYLYSRADMGTVLKKYKMIYK